MTKKIKKENSSKTTRRKKKSEKRRRKKVKTQRSLQSHLSCLSENRSYFLKLFESEQKVQDKRRLREV
jgi:hypothetical protein